MYVNNVIISSRAKTYLYFCTSSFRKFPELVYYKQISMLIPICITFRSGYFPWAITHSCQRSCPFRTFIVEETGRSLAVTSPGNMAEAPKPMLFDQQRSVCKCVVVQRKPTVLGPFVWTSPHPWSDGGCLRYALLKYIQSGRDPQHQRKPPTKPYLCSCPSPIFVCKMIWISTLMTYA
jgi:hypothetical protein